MNDLRRFRDHHGLSMQWPELGVRVFYSPSDMLADREDSEIDAFFDLVATRFDSLEEKRVSTRLAERYLYIPENSVRGFFHKDRDDLIQVAMVGMLECMRRYFPTIVPFPYYAASSCRWAIIVNQSQEFFEGFTQAERKQYSKIYSFVRDKRRVLGEAPGVRTIAERLDLPESLVHEALRYLGKSHSRSLDAVDESTGLSKYEGLATVYRNSD
ncbi:hypothetical protein GCM10009853_093740 [Glycomyces scopariae]